MGKNYLGSIYMQLSIARGRRRGFKKSAGFVSTLFSRVYSLAKSTNVPFRHLRHRIGLILDAQGFSGTEITIPRLVFEKIYIRLVGISKNGIY
jgi:hypothetical protein